ncbi:MAG: SGNH/GDSL hydrolase family protein [Chitinophagaceae bacterium]|nr:SGNH/GDSL hydrolase family protein [Oligoflexus sp.]
MRSYHLVLGLSLSLSIFGCGKDKKKNDTAGDNGSQAQSQVYTEALNPSKPLLVVYGDSLSTGVLANTTLGQTPDNSLVLQLASYVKEQEYNATGFQANLSHTDLAAATTKNDYGVRASVAAQLGVNSADVGVVSLAKFGGQTTDLEHQLAAWQLQEKSNIPKKPENIFVMMGGNDYCSDRSVDDIVKTFNDQTAAIHKDSPDAQMIIAPAPPIDQLAAIDFTYGPALTQVTGQELSCRTFRDKLCKRIYDDPAAVKTRITSINSGIQAAATSLKAGGAKVVFVDGILSWQIKPEELAVDCFHPSAAGQTTIGNFVKAALAKPL